MPGNVTALAHTVPNRPAATAGSLVLQPPAPCLVDMVIGMVGSGIVGASRTRAQAGRLPSSPGGYRFRIRGGRLSGWDQRRCAGEAARRQCSETPPEWTAFATRNALLAAKLTR